MSVSRYSAQIPKKSPEEVAELKRMLDELYKTEDNIRLRAKQSGVTKPLGFLSQIVSLLWLAEEWVEAIWIVWSITGMAWAKKKQQVTMLPPYFDKFVVEYADYNGRYYGLRILLKVKPPYPARIVFDGDLKEPVEVVFMDEKEEKEVNLLLTDAPAEINIHYYVDSATLDEWTQQAFNYAQQKYAETGNPLNAIISGLDALATIHGIMRMPRGTEPDVVVTGGDEAQLVVGDMDVKRTIGDVSESVSEASKEEPNILDIIFKVMTSMVGFGLAPVGMPAPRQKVSKALKKVEKAVEQGDVEKAKEAVAEIEEVKPILGGGRVERVMV